jgi:hypothetical protein
MEKRLFLLGIIFALMFLPVISASCSLDADLINQDPYPAIPGDYVKLVFQLDGTSDSDCGEVSFWIDEIFPLSIISGMPNERTIRSSTYIKDFSDHWLIPYTLKISEDALDGDAELIVYYKSKGVVLSEKFNITIENPTADFEVRIISYDTSTKDLTLEILNIGKTDVDALNIEIPMQENAQVYGSISKTIGSIESNEDERVTFKADVEEGNIDLLMLYNDQNNIRRAFKTKAYLDKTSLIRSVEDDKNNFSLSSFIYGIIGAIIIFSLYRWNKHRKNKKKFLKEQQRKNH